MIITVSGPIGSGKSTVARILATRTGYEYISGGDMFRQSARDLGMSIEEFNLYAEKHPEIDRKQDDTILDILKAGDGIVFDSRLSGWLAHKNGVKAFKIFIYATPEKRISRVLEREGGSFENISVLLKERENSEKKRYMEFYGIDVDSTTCYDLVIESDDITAEEVADRAFLAFTGGGR